MSKKKTLFRSLDLNAAFENASEQQKRVEPTYVKGALFCDIFIFRGFGRLFVFGAGRNVYRA